MERNVPMNDYLKIYQRLSKSWDKHFIRCEELLTDIENDSSHNINKIESAANIFKTTISQGNKIISCGNGGSMCDAMHFAEELTGKFRDERKPLPAIAISDPSHITCVGNDYGFANIFSKYIEGVGKGFLSSLNLPVSSSAKCMASHIDPPFPQEMILFP